MQRSEFDDLRGTWSYKIAYDMPMVQTNSCVSRRLGAGTPSHKAYDMSLPSSAKIIIIGGGIVGCSVAYHLGKMGVTDVLLIEKDQLTSGSTWHAAGLVGQLRTSANITQLLAYSVKLYDTLEAEVGLATGWKRNGGLRLACNQERWTEVKRQATTFLFSLLRE